MIKLSKLKVIENAFFRNKLEYNKPSLYPFIEKNFSEDKVFDKETINKLSALIDGTSDNLAHNILLKKDISTISKSIKKKDMLFDEKFWILKLSDIHKKIEKHLGLKFKLKNIRFCELFPEEYKNLAIRGASTITVFEGNEHAGIYYLNKRIDNTSTPIHIIHEQIHTCLSQNKDKDQIFVEWFEEGIAILYSILIYYEITKDIQTINAYKNRSYIFSRTKPEWDFTKRYFEYMKIISRIFLMGGFDKLKHLIREYLKNNREHINSYLQKIQIDSLPVKYLPKNEIETFIFNFSNMIEPEQITPLEYVIVHSLNEPRTVEQISIAINAPLEVTNNALNRLFGKGICLITKNSKIDLNWRKKDLFEKKLIKPVYPF